VVFSKSKLVAIENIVRFKKGGKTNSDDFFQDFEKAT
jgi:hypothetical protein